MSYDQNTRYKKIKSFLDKQNFNGFTDKDLFIMSIIKKGWGHDIAALSNMAEALSNIAIREGDRIEECRRLLRSVIKRAVHPKVNPYKKNIREVTDLGKFGYYLEHLNIILGSYRMISDDDIGIKLNKRISHHLVDNSMRYDNYHADLLPHVKMKWSADQAAILYSIWLYDQNSSDNISAPLIDKWIEYMETQGTHKTGLYKTEVLGTRKYSSHPRGCSMSYLIHYMARFAPELARDKWNIYKKHMLKNVLSYCGFREYLEDYNGSWSPDSGPIIMGIGVAASGLGLNAASTIGDVDTYKKLEKSMSPFISMLSTTESYIGSNMLTRVGTDLLASSIWLNAESKVN